MKIKILLLGATGLLGQAWHRFLAQNSASVELLTPSSNELNLLLETEIGSYLQQNKPDFVINCVGYNQVDLAETDQEAQKLCQILNADLVKTLTDISKKNNFVLLQYSTDYVFDGKKSEPYTENDQQNPLSFYGQTKAEAEQYLQLNGGSYYLIRTAWLFGEGKTNFVEKMISLADTQPEIKVVDDQIGSPTYTNDLVTASWELITKNMDFGTYNIVNSGQTSWYELTKKIFALINKNVNLSAIKTAEFKRPAPRPHFSVLTTTKTPALRGWELALKDYLTTITK